MHRLRLPQRLRIRPAIRRIEPVVNSASSTHAKRLIFAPIDPDRKSNAASSGERMLSRAYWLISYLSPLEAKRRDDGLEIGGSLREPPDAPK